MTPAIELYGTKYEIHDGKVSLPVHHLVKILDHIKTLEHKFTESEFNSSPEVGPSCPPEVARRIENGGNPVRIYRKHRGLTQKELAAQTGLSTSMLSELENGIKTGSLDTLKKLAAALDADLGLLIRD